MIETARGFGAMVTSPHRLASDAGLEILRAGGNAVDALIAALATLGVVMPHMTGIGGDGFWLLAPPGGDPIGIDAAGSAGEGVTPALYGGADAIPIRGRLAANTVAGAVAGWAQARAAAAWGRRLPLGALLARARHHAEEGAPVARGLAADIARCAPELGLLPGFADVFLPGGAPPETGQRLRQPALAATLRALAEDGLDGFYRGALARRIASDLGRVGAPVTSRDLAAFSARRVAPLALDLSHGRVWNLPPPTQGLASLLILGIFDRLGVETGEGFSHVHGLIEATKRAFRVRDTAIGDPDAMRKSPSCYLSGAWLDRAAAGIDRARASPWPHPSAPGDTVWCGAVDREGGIASAIGSIFFEFGSGVVLPETGILWQNRGAAFSLAGDGPRLLAPGRKPFHTLNPALAFLADGRRMAYGTMGGEGQPQTQAAVFTRHVRFGMELQRAVTAPRWLLGRTWGDAAAALRVEEGVDAAVVADLQRAGHEVVRVPDFSQVMGHAGAVVLRPDGLREGAADPRSDGVALCE